MRIDAMKRAVIDALEDVKAKDIVAFNVTKMTTLCDWVVIASGDSNRQTKALAVNVRNKLKEAGAEEHSEVRVERDAAQLGDVVRLRLLKAFAVYPLRHDHLGRGEPPDDRGSGDHIL